MKDKAIIQQFLEDSEELLQQMILALEEQKPEEGSNDKIWMQWLLFHGRLQRVSDMITSVKTKLFTIQEE